MPGLQLGHTVGHPWLWWHHAHKMARHGVLQSTWKGFYTTCLSIPWLPLCDHQGALGGITKQVPSHETGHKWEHFIIWNSGVCVTHEKKQECGCVFLRCQDVCVAIRAYFKRGVQWNFSQHEECGSTKTYLVCNVNVLFDHTLGELGGRWAHEAWLTRESLLEAKYTG